MAEARKAWSIAGISGGQVSCGSDLPILGKAAAEALDHPIDGVLCAIRCFSTVLGPVMLQ